MSAAKLIQSPANAAFRRWESLLESRGIRRHGRFLLAGRKLVPEALANWPRRFEAILRPETEDESGLPAASGMDSYRLARPLFDRLDVSGTGFPLLVGRLPDMPAVDLTQPPQGLELVAGLGDPVNLGALLRSAAAFGVARLILLEEAAHPFHPRCLRAAANAPFRLSISRGATWADLAGAAGPLHALDLTGEDLRHFHWPRHLRLVLGEEGLGLPRGLQATRLSIPTSGRVESLNATVAASLALYGWFIAWGGEAPAR
ncbi:MAG: RNA methyltransferase [Alphaproteobacteria bacterium]|nr:RNA methyltransferase [Alphaproteobacteria bacterium]